MKTKIIIPYEVLVELYVNKKLSQKQIAQELGFSIDTIVRNLKEYGIPSHKPKDWLCNDEIELTPLQIEVINGALLGDGCLYLPKAGNANFSYTSSIYNHVNYVYEYFKDYVTDVGISKNDYFDNRTNKTYTSFLLRTQCNTFFTDLRQKWYDNIKIIPKDLQLTPLTCLIWYLGDGYICNSSKSQYIKLATNYFSRSDIEEVLISQLKDFDAKIMKADKEDQHFIYIPHRKIKDFLLYLGDCPFEDYKYKWTYREYKNSMPKNHTEYEKDFVDLFQQGWTYYKIAKHFGIEPNAVKYYLVKNKLYEGNEKHD